MAKPNIICIEKVDSTNNYAMALIKKGAILSDTCVFAMEQTLGKGRRGKQWIALSGLNITLSIVAEMKWQPISGQFRLSIAVALACREFIASLLNQTVYVKWPNDIFINDSKAAGVLIENILKGTIWQWTVIGIGLNVNQETFDEVDAMVTSLKKETGLDYKPLELAEDLHMYVLKKIEDLKAGKYDEMLTEYNTHLYARNKLAKFKKENIIFETTVRSVSETGQLITTDIIERCFNFDEVTFCGLVE